MNYKLQALSSGLRLLTVPMPGLESVTVTVWVKTGSRNEEKRVNGISHFLEHMVFKGSKKRPTAKEISETVDSFGGEQNAFTSKDITSFYIKSSVDRIETAMDVLSDMVLNPILDPREIEREKGTIIQEIAMYEDNPQMKIHDLFENLLYSNNSLGWDIAGDGRSVGGMKKNDFVRYRGMHYHTDNMLVTVAGGIREDKVKNLVEKYFTGIKSRKSAAKKSLFKGVWKKPRILIKNKKYEQANLILGFLGEGRGYEGRFAQNTISTILNGGMSSRLFIEVRERRGLAYSVQPANERYQETGYVGAYAGTDPGKAEEATKVMLDQFYGLASGKYPVSQRELTKAKEYSKGHLALSLEDTNAVNMFFSEQALFLPDILTPEELSKRIDSVTIDQVMVEAKKLFRPEKLNLAIIGPYKDESKFRKLLS